MHQYSGVKKGEERLPPRSYLAGLPLKVTSLEGPSKASRRSVSTLESSRPCLWLAT